VSDDLFLAVPRTVDDDDKARRALGAQVILFTPAL
jgi:hypothetical protein